MVDSGMRCSEAASARRVRPAPSRNTADVWLLTVLGTGHMERLVPVSVRTVDALRIHRRDWGLDFSDAQSEAPLPSLVQVPPACTAISRHENPNAHGYRSASLVQAGRRRAAPYGRVRRCPVPDEGEPFTADYLLRPATTSPHAFRHTFATPAVESDMPLELAQEILGHAQVTPTRIYLRAREKRVAAAAGKYFGGMAQPEV
jgi:integrase